MPLYRVVNPRAVPVEYRCISLSEEALYGRLNKKGERSSNPADYPPK